MYDIHQTSDSNFPKRGATVFRKYLNLSFVLSREEWKWRKETAIKNVKESFTPELMNKLYDKLLNFKL